MKEGWTYKKLGEVAMLKNGFAFKSSLFKETGTPIVRISNIQDDRITTDFVYFDKNDYRETLDKYEVYEGDILIAMSGATTGKVGINTNSEVLYLNQRVGKFVPQKELYSLFLFYYLKRNANFSLSVAQGMAQPNLSTQQINNFIIPIPPLAEQERIVAELDLLSRIIDKKKAQLKELDQLAQSIFYNMFGDPITNEKAWEVKKLKEVSLEKLSYGSGASSIPFNDDVRYIRITDINDNGELNEDTVSPNVFDEKYLLNEGDILFARSGATVGKTFQYKSKYGKCIYAGYLIRLIPNKEIILPSYIFGYTKSPFYRGFVLKAQNAVAQPNINAKQYSELPIPLPPLPLQQEFASKVEAIEQQKSLIQQSIVETQTLFDSRMDHWFG